MRAVVFDLFGTLVDDLQEASYQRSLEEMAGVLGVERGAFAREWEAFREERALGAFRTIEESIARVCHSLGEEADEVRLEAATQLRIHFMRAMLQPRPGATETLARVRGQGLRTGLLSDCSVDVPVLWADTAFAPLVDAAVFSPVEGRRKPDGRLYHKVCTRLQVEPGECLYVGDGNSEELSGATRAGMLAVLIAVPGRRSFDYGALEAERWQGLRIESLEAVLDFL